jgi:hypothetical protein
MVIIGTAQEKASKHKTSLLCSCPADRRPSKPCGAGWDRGQGDQEQKIRVRGKFRPYPLVGFPEEKQGRAECTV